MRNKESEFIGWTLSTVVGGCSATKAAARTPTTAGMRNKESEFIGWTPQLLLVDGSATKAAARTPTTAGKKLQNVSQ
jgi:hypothetical protein